MRNAVGEGPVVFFNKLGQQVIYNLSLIKFVGEDPTLADGKPEDTDLTIWLKKLVKQGRLAPGSDVVPPPVALLELEAAQPGKLGNEITFEVTSVATGEVDVTVTWTDKYQGLTLATLPTRLDAAASRPGLVQLQAAPVGGPPVEFPFAAPTEDPGPPPTAAWKINDDSKVTFVLEPRAHVAIEDARRISVEILVDPLPPGADPADTTFTLTARWQNKVEHVTSGHLADIVSTAAGQPPGPFDFALKVSAHGNGLPALVKVNLQQGSDTVAATKATASIFAQ